jgi:hypothetical protein
VQNSVSKIEPWHRNTAVYRPTVYRCTSSLVVMLFIFDEVKIKNLTSKRKKIEILISLGLTESQLDWQQSWRKRAKKYRTWFWNCVKSTRQVKNISYRIFVNVNKQCKIIMYFLFYLFLYWLIYFFEWWVCQNLPDIYPMRSQVLPDKLKIYRRYPASFAISVTENDRYSVLMYDRLFLSFDISVNVLKNWSGRGKFNESVCVLHTNQFLFLASD